MLEKSDLHANEILKLVSNICGRQIDKEAAWANGKFKLPMIAQTILDLKNYRCKD